VNEGVGQVIIEVEDQDRALEFWSNTVGFELAHDAPYGESRRWIEVTTRDKAVVLVFSRRRGDRPTAPEELPTSNIFVYCYDLSRTHEELRERGAEFPVPPRQMHFRWWSLFEDQHGTRYALGRWDCKDYARLDRLIGTWKTEGWTTEAPADRIDAVDTYERLPGGALLHPLCCTLSTPAWQTSGSRAPRSSATTPPAAATSRGTSAATGPARTTRT